MSALSDCVAYVSFVPEADIAPLHSITLSARPISVLGTNEAERLGSLQVEDQLALVACCTGRSAGFSPLRMRPA
jgi:hypothetical protein